MNILCPKCSSKEVDFLKKRNEYICAECDNRFKKEKERQQKRIFLSYGRDEYAELAVRIQRDLESRGHEVWFDLERLKAGGNWEAYIEEGLEWVSANPKNSLIIFLMTPHSTRRPDGFCLKELSRGLSRGLPVIPVMIVWCESPLSICDIQWLDMQKCNPIDENEEQYQKQFEHLCEAIEHDRITLEGVQSRLRHHLNPLPFDAEIEGHLLKFTGRKWIFNQVDAWLQNPSASRVFWIVGKPGVGKTAIAAWLCSNRREIAAFYLCVYGHTQKSDPRNCVLSIAYQLSTQLHEYQLRLNSLKLEKIVAESNARTLFDTLINQPLSHNFPKPDHRVIILIDALDEATEGGTNQLASFLASEFAKTPPWLSLIITSRPDPQVKYPLQCFSPYEVDTSAPESEKDIRLYLTQELKPFYHEEIVPKDVIDTIIERSEGLFLYVQCILEALREGELSLDRLNEFPNGLGGYYWRYFERKFPIHEKDRQSGQPDLTAYKSSYRQVLEIITAARGPLEVRYIASLFGWNEYQEDILQVFGSLISIRKGRIYPFHRSVIEWLTNKEKAGIEFYFVSTKEGHKRLANNGWREYQHGSDTMSNYTRDHLPAHLIATGRWDDLKTFLSEPLIMKGLMTEERQYELMGYWLSIGDNLNMIDVYHEALDLFKQSGASQEEFAQILCKVANFMTINALYREAIILHKEALEIRKVESGEESTDTASTLNELAEAYMGSGDFKSAEFYLHQAFTIRKKVHGNDHRDTASTLNSLSELCWHLGRNSEAEAYVKQALDIRMKVLGTEHPDTANSLNNLAAFYANLGNSAKAEPLYKQAFDIRMNVLGTEHPDTATSLNNLATLYANQGKNEKAEILYFELLEILEKLLGSEHQTTCKIRKSLEKCKDKGE